MKHTKHLCLALILSMLITLTGCSVSKQNNNIVANTVVTYDISIMEKEALSFIKNDESDFSNKGLVIDQKDISTEALLEESYYSGNSFYLHISNRGMHYMYRFQLSDNDVVSYIKYEYKR